MRIPNDLPARLAERLQQPLPGPAAQRRFEPELSYGRHYQPPPADVRRAAVVALLYPCDGDWHLPLTVRSERMPSHAGQVSFPGGALAAGEASHEAALRELDEELGVPAEGIRLLGPMSPLYIFVTNFYITPWLATVESKPRLTPCAREVARVLELPVAHLLDPANVGTKRHHHGELSFTAPHIQFASTIIWGATSMMLGELAALVEDVAD